MSKLISFFLLIFASVLGYCNTFDQALIHYTNKEFESAYKIFESLSKLGNADAQTNIGVMFYRGEYVEKDITSAYAWVKVAKENGSLGGEKLFDIVDRKISNSDREKAENKYARISQEYSGDVVFEKMSPKLNMVDVGIYKPERIKRKVGAEYPVSMAKLGEQGYVDIQYTVDRDGITRNHVVMGGSSNEFKDSALKAVKQWRYQPASYNGHTIPVYAKNARLNFYMAGSEIKQEDIDKMLSPFQEKALKGGDSAMFSYARALEIMRSYARNADGEEIVLDNPNKWYFKSAQYGSSVAKYFLGKNSIQGRQCAANDKIGLFWLEQSALENVIEAKFVLGMELIHGVRLARDFDRGFRLVKEAADAGMHDANLKLAEFVASGAIENGSDFERPETYLKRVKEKEYQDKLTYYQVNAICHANSKNFKAAVKWQKKALKEAKKYSLPTENIELVLKDIQEGKNQVYRL